MAPLATGFSWLAGVAVDGSGNVYAADPSNGTVYEITKGGSTTTLASGFNEPLGLAVDGSGNVYVGDGNGHLYEIAANGGGTTST